MGPVERAIRAQFPLLPKTLHTIGRGKQFEFREMNADRIVLLLGDGEWPTPLTWECLESVPPFLRSQPGWVPAGGKHSVTGEPGTLDQHLKPCQTRDVARWLTVVLRDAGVVQVSERPKLRLRLTKEFGG